MNKDLPIQDLMIEDDPQTVILPAEEGTSAPVDREEEDEVSCTVTVPQGKCPEEIEQVAHQIYTLGQQIGKATAIADLYAITRVLRARWAGETNMSRLAAIMGVQRQSLYRMLERGRKKEHSAYEIFHAAFDQLHGATVLNSLEVVRHAAHTGNVKAASEHLKYAAPDLSAKEQNGSESPVNVNVLNVSGVLMEIMAKPVSERLGLAMMLLPRMPTEAQKTFAQMLPKNMQEMIAEQIEDGSDVQPGT